MNVASLLDPEILDAVKAIGLVSDTGDIDSSWFATPSAYLESILTNATQRAAVLDLLDLVLPPQAVPGAPAGEKWHPLLGTQPDGNLYLTVGTADPVVIGFAGAFTALASPAVTVMCRLPMASLSGTAFTPIAGTATGPLEIDLAITLNWTRPANPIVLAAITASLNLSPLATPPASIELTLHGIDLDGKGAADKVLTPADFGSEAVQLLLALIQAELSQLAASASGELKLLVDHLPALLGLDGSLPMFPFTSLASDPKALANWFTQLTTGAPAPMVQWLAHLAGLLGVSVPAVATGNSWTVPLLALNAQSSANLTVSSAKAPDGVTPLLGLGIDLSLMPGASAPVRVDASLSLLSLPLAGSTPPTAFPSASITVTAPGQSGQQLISPGGGFSVDTLRAGLSWNGQSIVPLLQLTNVVLPGASPYPVIDLTNANTVEAAASSTAAGAIQSALGNTGAGAHIAALAGLIEPASDNSAPLVDLTQLVSHPTSAIATLHRQALLSSTHPWSIYLNEIAALLGLSGGVAGAGTTASPWVANIATTGPLSVGLAAWNAQTSGNASDPQLLRLAIQLSANAASAQASWTTEIFSADLPASGPNQVRLLGGHHGSASITPGTIAPINGIGIQASSLTAELDIVPGTRPVFQAAVNGLVVTTPTGPLNITSLKFPFPSGFDITNPVSLGISVAQLEQLVIALLARELSDNFGSVGLAIAVLIGAGSGAPGLQADFPALTDPAGPGSLFSDPLSALRAWVSKLATQVSADGSSFLNAAIPWLQGWLSSTLPANLTTPPNASSLQGTGTFEDPWVLPFSATAPAAGLLWLEPDGPPSMAPLAATAINAAMDFSTLATALGGAARYLGQSAPTGLAAGLTSLSTFLNSSDGVVPVTSQIPTGGTWSTGTAIAAAHPLQPADSSAVSQILSQVNTWAAPGSNRAMLLLGPAFTDHLAWTTLLTQAETANPGTTKAAATFNLRVAGVAPASIDLRPVTAVADFYTADLQDDGTGDFAGLTSQIGLITARILALKPNAAIVIVAHSTAGVPARMYAAANAAQVKGLVTLGTPHQGSPLTPLTDTATAEAVRAIGALLPGGLAGGPLEDAISHLRTALDGYLPPSAGGLPPAAPYPYGDFVGAAGTDTGGVPALALGGQLGGAAGVDLLAALKTSASAAVSAFVAKAPTHLAFGAKMALPLGADSAVAADAAVRLNAGRLALQSAAPNPPQPACSLSVDLAISRPGGWLAGGPLSYAGLGAAPVDIRVRSAELGAVFTLNGSAVQAAPYVRLHDAAFHGVTLPQVNWGDAQLAASLGSIFSSIAATAPAAGSSLASLLSALQALGVCAADASGGIGVAADALTALQADPLGFLAAHAPAAFSAAAIPGFTAVTGGFSYQPVSLPVEILIQTSPASVALSTVTGSGLQLATDLSLNFSIALPLGTMTPAVSAGLQLGSIALNFASGALTLAIPPALSSLQLYPPPAASTVLAALEAALPWLLVEAAGTAVLDSVVSAGFAVTGLVSFLTDPGTAIIKSTALGDGTVLDPVKVNQLLALLGPLPGGLSITAAGKSPTSISLTTTAPIGGVLGLSLGISIDQTRHLAPTGSFTLQSPLGGTWPSVAITFGVDPSGIALSIQPGGAAAIELLPTFSGSAAFASAAETLLPAALDGLVGALPAANSLLKLSLEVATALNIYDAAGGFRAHSAQLTAMLNGTWFSTLATTARTAFLNAASAYFNDATSPLKGLLPGTISVSGTSLNWSFPVPGGVGTGTLALAAGWDGSGPTLHFSAQSITLTNAPFAVTAGFGYASGSLALDTEVAISLATIGIATPPVLDFSLAGSALSLGLLPLGAGTASTLSLQLLPTPQFTVGSDAAEKITEDWAIPLAADLLITATGTQFSQALWSGGPTIETVLKNAQIINIGAGPAPGKYTLKTPLPDVPTLVSNIASALSPVTIPIVADPPLSLTFSNAGNVLGIGLLGSISLSSGSPSVSLLLGKPADWLGPNAGVTLDLLTTGSSIAFAPALAVRGLGVGLAGDGDSPLLNASGFRIGAVDAYLAFTIDLLHGTVSGLGGGLEIDQLGLPLNQLSGAGSSNPVAASLFDTSGGSGQGDTSPANPAVDVIVYYLDSNFVLEFQGTNQPIVIPVHASFGPIYIDQIDLSLPDTKSVEIGVDGSAKINGLDVGVDELALVIPVQSITKPGDWTLDLQGLAVGFSAGVVEISGGLRKNPGPPIEYDGMLSVTIADIGLTIVGAYSQPIDTQGSYTSLFMFISLPIPLGGPPFAFIMGLGGGFGYNRELEVPQDLDDIDSFLLVAAIDDSSLANDPMGALMKMSTSIPARRGAFWLAAGVRFTSFALINSVVIVAVALDRGFEIDILGISRMALPTEDTALVSVELALKARYNSEEGVLSIQAQLTDNSYLFTRDCQLTGGFAFFIWYTDGQFVLTLGGYNAVFSKPPEFPDVPRLGFNFSVGSLIVIKGGAYFALTNSCVMAGGSLDATASIGPVSAWFKAFVDILIGWDPFEYEFDIGVEIGVSLSVRICFFGCVTIGISISVGAQLQISGPPFHGTATIDEYVVSVTIAFGDPPQQPNYITEWSVFSGKYLVAGVANGNAVSLQFTKGVLVPDPPGAQPQPGTQAQPWQIGVEFIFQSTTRMPTVNTLIGPVQTTPVPMPNSPVLDIAPMYELGIGSSHAIQIQQLQTDGSWQAPTLTDPGDHFTITQTTGFFPEATWHWVDPFHVPAGARTITAIAGLSVDGHVVFNNPSALIPISTLVADLAAFALPLPFAFVPTFSATLQGYGADAAALSASIAGVTSQKMLAASATILTGNNVFSQNRTAFNLPPSGISPIASLSLQTSRSSPPLVMPITTGLTMKPVGLPAPNVAETIIPISSIVLEQPRLRAAMQRPAPPVSDTPIALHTTVTKTVTAGASSIPRMVPPAAVTLAGARLIRIPSATAPRPTRASAVPRTLRNAAGGTAIAAGHQQAIDAAGAALLSAGVTLAGGAAHVWQLPQDAGSLEIKGTGALRVVFAKRNGASVSDTEYVITNSASIGVPSGAFVAVVESLGNLPSGTVAPTAGFAAITSSFAPAQQQVAVGWQATGTLLQIGPTELLGRGAAISLVRIFGSRNLRQKASYGVAVAASALLNQPAVETTLPGAVSVVMIALDLADASAAVSQDDLAIAVSGATLNTPPQRVSSANRRLLLYDVASLDQQATEISISVASTVSWIVAGVIGVHGSAQEWATQLAAGVPDHFVPDGPLTPDGSLTITWASPTAGGTV